jgi:hypothetical protein
MLLTVARFLLQAIALHRSRVGLAILLPIIRVLYAPLARALPARLTIVRIGRDLVSAVVGTALFLAAGITANDLLLLASPTDRTTFGSAGNAARS